ncbi:hypothetical protein SDC9_106471 [bioreactor metagenome]|uniref:Outer membrane protein beta-barrel domain-containing protein n=1 Tax=bioreactor metagenome TaxID=1076179 RepID=A0A645B3H1_9ZZZZ
MGSVWSQDVFYKADHFDFLIGIGFSFGRIALVRNDYSTMNQSGKYTNPFFSPKIVMEPRVLFGPLSLAIRCEFLCDISKQRWNLKDTELPEIPESSSSGLFYQLVLGIRLMK